MGNIWTIAKREYKHYFISPIAYVVAFILLLVLGYLFYANILSAVIQQSAPTVQIVISPLVTLLLFTIPAITMRTLAEEQRQGTLELLLTAPVRDWELVAGKWLGGFLFILSILLITWVYPAVLNQMVSPGIDQGVLLTGYLGLVLNVAALVAIGVAVSSFFSNQIAAFFVCLGIVLVFWMIGFPGQVSNGTAATLLRYLDMSEHFYNTFYQGIIELQDIVFYLSMTALALFVGTVSLEARRWR
jgi:ABC-2 type transport system permease protein